MVALLRACAFGFALSLLADASVYAARIVYQAIDLPDLSAGADLWQYRYSIGETFDPFEGFTLLFDPARYASLEDASDVDSDWFSTVTQPNPALPASGLFNSFAQHAHLGPGHQFRVSFIWLGDGIPGAQPFELFDQSFDVTAQGVTIAVPEPFIGNVLAIGLLALCAGPLRKLR